jgi:non-heme Fe2+,alpha-ketoglutarate-dependent halogenase
MSQPAFIPPPDALETVPRDLRFHPTPDAAFNRDGYLKPFRIFDSAEISAIRSYFDDLLARTLAAGGTSYSISTAHLRYGRVYDILRDPRIVAHVRSLLGDDVIGWGSHFFCKMPGDGKRVSWHQDASYWPLTPSKTVTVWLAIDDADVGNACMRYLPRSHWHGHLTYTLTEDDDSNVLNQTVTDAAQFGDPVDVELRAGEISLHSDLLVHGSEANQSTRRRCGLTLRYCPAEVRAGLGWNAKGVVVSGSDPSGHWANPPRPVED